MHGPGGDIRPGSLERSFAAARGTTTVTTRAAPTATGTIPTTVTTTSAFGWCCVRPTSFSPFFWFRRQPAGRRSGAPAPTMLRKCGPIRASGFARRGEGRRTAPGRSGPRACREAGRHQGHRPRRADSQARARPGHRARRRPPLPTMLIQLPRRLRVCHRWPGKARRIGSA